MFYMRFYYYVYIIMCDVYSWMNMLICMFFFPLSSRIMHRITGEMDVIFHKGWADLFKILLISITSEQNQRKQEETAKDEMHGVGLLTIGFERSHWRRPQS